MKTSSGVRSRAESVCGRKVQECSEAVGCWRRWSGERRRATPTLSDTRLTMLALDEAVAVLADVAAAAAAAAAAGSSGAPKSRASVGRIRRQMRARSSSRGATVHSKSSGC